MDQRELANILIRHAVGSERFGAGLADKIVRLLNSADADLVAQIGARYSVIKSKGYDRGPATTKRLEDLLQSIRSINSNVYGQLAKSLPADLADVAQHEMDFTRTAGEKTGSPVKTGTQPPSADFLHSLVTNTPIDGILLASWVSGLETARLDRLTQAIRLSAVKGETTDQLVARIAGTKAAQYTDGILNISRRSAQTFAITTNATIQNAARMEVFKQMPSVGFVEWSAILDNRTSAICQSLSGKIWGINDPHPTPPAHPRCRSILLPRRDTGEPLHKPYSEWLKGQSAGNQDRVLGKKRGEAFRTGKLPPEELYRADGSFKSLDELKAFDKSLFEPEGTTAKVTVINPAQLDEEARRYVLNNGTKTGNEHLTGYDLRTGRTITPKEGGFDYVEFSPELNRLAADPENELVLHHNHPRSSSLSFQDLKVVSANPGIKSIWAHGHNESSFYAERGTRTLKKSTVDAISRKIVTQLQGLINIGALSVEDAQLMSNHLAWLALDRVGEIKYVAELAGSSAEAFARNKALFERVLESLK